MTTPLHFQCQQCGRALQADEGLKYGNLRICVSCKSAFLTRLQERGSPPDRAGPWRLGNEMICTKAHQFTPWCLGCGNDVAHLRNRKIHLVSNGIHWKPLVGVILFTVAGVGLVLATLADNLPIWTLPAMLGLAFLGIFMIVRKRKALPISITDCGMGDCRPIWLDKYSTVVTFIIFAAILTLGEYTNIKRLDLAAIFLPWILVTLLRRLLGKPLPQLSISHFDENHLRIRGVHPSVLDRLPLWTQ